MTSQPDDTLAQLTAAGVAVWLDDISRERLSTGNLAALMRDLHVARRDVQSDDLRERDVQRLRVPRAARRPRGARCRRRRGGPGDHHLRHPVGLRRAAPGLRRRPAGVDGRVSIEVDPRIAGDTAKTIAEARALWWLVDRPNLFIKIPATLEGLPAITQCLSEGISINVTLIFSLQRYGQVIDAFMAGLEEAAGRDVRASPRSRRSSSAGWTPRWTAGWTRSARPRPRRCAARPRSPTRGWPTSCSSRSSPRPRWTALGARGARAAAAAVGLDQHQGPGLPGHHVRRGAGRAAHGQHHAGGDDARHRRPMACCAATRSTAPTRSPGRCSPTWRARHQLRRRGGRPGGRGRAEVRRLLARAARDDQDRDGRCGGTRAAARRRTSMTTIRCAIRGTAGSPGSPSRACWSCSASPATWPARSCCRPSTTWPTAACCRPGSRWSASPAGTGWTRTSRS